MRRSNRSSSLISRILPAWTPGAMAFGPVTLAAFLCPAHAVAIPAQVVLAGMSFMLPVIPVVCLLLVWIYALVARHRRLKGFMARIPGALFLVLLTIIAFTFFVKLSSSVGGLIDPAAEAKLVDFITDNASRRREIAGLDQVRTRLLEEPAEIRGTPQTIGPEEVVREVAAGRMMVVDVRPSYEFSRGHLEGAWRFPRYDVERAVHEYWSQTATDLYLDSLARTAAADGRKLALCCSFGVSVSYRTVMELRSRGVPAVMVIGGCTALRDHGGRFIKAPAVAGDDGFIQVDEVADWIEAGVVKSVYADETIVADLGKDLPDGPIVVVTRGDSPQERALRPIVAAIAQSRGISVVGWSVIGSDSPGKSGVAASARGMSLARLGFAVEETAGVVVFFLLLLVCSAGVVLTASGLPKSPRSVLRWVGLVMALGGASVAVAMFDGTHTAAHISLFFGNHGFAPILIFLVTFLLVLARLLRRQDSLPRLELASSPVDGDTGAEGTYRWPWVLISILVATTVALLPPPAAVLTVAVLTVICGAVFVRDAALLLVARIIGLRLRRAQSDSSSQSADTDVRVPLAGFLAALAFPGLVSRAVRCREAVEIVTRVPGRPGMLSMRVGDAPSVTVGMLSLSAPDVPLFHEHVVARARLAVAVASGLGIDLKFTWTVASLTPRVTIPMGYLRDSFQPDMSADIRDAVLHRQVINVATLVDGFGLGPLDGQTEVVSAERYAEQDPAPTPLTFSILAARSTRRGPAHMTGLMFGFSRYHSRTVRLGAGIYEVLRRSGSRDVISGLRIWIARQYVKALDAVFSDFVLPEAMAIAETVAHGHGRIRCEKSAVGRLLGYVAIFQEATAVAHALILESCLRAGGDGALGRFGDARSVPRAGSLSVPASWELMPRSGGDQTMPPSLDAGFLRILEPVPKLSGSRFDRDIVLWRRVEEFRGAFRRLTGWACGVIGREFASVGAATGLGDLIFFSRIDELRCCRGRFRGFPVATLQSRRTCLDSVRTVKLPMVVTVGALESMAFDNLAVDHLSGVGAETIQNGVLVSGRLPVSGRVRLLRDGFESGPFGQDDIVVIGASDSSVLVRLLDCAAVVAESGGRLSHAAMLAREVGLTFVSGVAGARSFLREGDSITIGTDLSIHTHIPVCSDEVHASGSVEMVELSSAAAECGNKAASLAAVMSAGLQVPPGFVLPDRWLRRACPGGEMMSPQAAGEIWQKIRSLDMGSGFIARSSAEIEDGTISSFAGVFRTVAGISDPDSLALAVRQCLESRDSPAASILMDRLGIRDRTGFSVILQPLVPAEYSGVAVSWLGSSGRDAGRDIVVEVQAGIGGVVDGAGETAAFAVRRVDNLVTPLNGASIPEGLDLAVPGAVADMLIRAERLFEGPCDMEWCLFRGEVWVVQSRPLVDHPK